MSRAVLIAALGVGAFFASSGGMFASAAPIPFPLPLPYLNKAVEILPISGRAWGVDGKNVVGSSGNIGFLYDGVGFTSIAFPGAAETTANGIEGANIVGTFHSGGFHGFWYNGSKYTQLDAPLGTGGTFARGISGTNIVGSYIDSAGLGHGFLYDGTTWTTLDHPLGVRGTGIGGIDGNNIVGTYTTALGRTRGFHFDGTTWTTLNDPFVMGAATIANDIDGDTIVGYSSFPPSYPFTYDGSTFDHPTLGAPNAVFTGISGNKIVGYYRDGPSGFDVPFIYTVPEPNSLTLGAMGGLIVLAVAHRARRRQGR